MSTPTHLVLPNSDAPTLPSPQLHLLPFHTPFSGPAPISTYFLPRSTPDTRESALPGSTLLLSAFRGRQLVGQNLHVPSGYKGVVLSVPEKRKAVKREEGEEEGGRRELAVKREDANEDVQEVEEGGRRVSPRKRKVVDRFGGLAPSKEPPAGGKVTKKFRIDSDSEEDEDDQPRASTSTTSTSAAATSTTATSIPTPLSPLPTLTGSSISSSSTSTPLPSTNATSVPSPPPSPPLQLVNDRPSRSPSPTSQPQPQSNSTHQEDEPEPPSLLLLPPSPPPPARELKILSSFGGNQGIVLWSADDPVDEGRDEYFRCLGKGGWMELAEVLHQEEGEE